MEENQSRRILLVEDDPKLSKLVKRYLEANGFAVLIEPNGLHASERILAEKPDLVILDILLPGKDGRTICREVRNSYFGPIIMLTALGDEVDEVVGLEIGADDYLVKPVSPRRLLSRVQAAIRRSVRTMALQTISTKSLVIGSLIIDQSNRTAMIGGRKLSLTTREFEFLFFFASNPGIVLSRDKISQAIRGIEYDGVDRFIDSQITRLRKKLGDDGKRPAIIKSIWGEGYLLVKDP
jgi:two-component system, OmpR family, response regulator RstA